MKVRFYSGFKKVPNSTKQPTDFTYTEVECLLKGESSIINPYMIISEDTFNNAWNYAYIPKWNRYYFLRDSTHNTGGRCTMELVVDPYASFKSEILTNEAYVARSASDYDLHLDDSTWTHNDSVASSSTTFSSGFVDLGSTPIGGTVIFSVQGKPYNDEAYSTWARKGAIGALGTDCQLYATTCAGWDELVKLIHDSSTGDGLLANIFENINADSEVLAKQFFNPAQYITNVMWLPIGITADGLPLKPSQTTGATIHCQQCVRDSDNNYTIPVAGFDWNTVSMTETLYMVCSSAIKITYTKTSSDLGHWNYNYWIDRNTSWSTYKLYVPSVGVVDLPSEFSGQTLTIDLYASMLTGKSKVIIKNAQGIIISSGEGQLGIPMSLSSVDVNWSSQLGVQKALRNQDVKRTNALGNAFSVAGSLLSGDVGKMLGGLTGAFHTVGSLESAQNTVDMAKATAEHDKMSPTISQMGSTGSKMEFYDWSDFVFMYNGYSCYDWDSTLNEPKLIQRIGGKCCKVRSLTGLQKFTQLVDPEINISGTAQEQSDINNGFISGVFIE